MENKNIVSSISFLEFVNNINSLINRLLYSSNEGYINLKSKNAIIGFCDFVKKFDNEAIKLSKDLDYSEVETLIKSKRKDLILQIQKHYNQELLVWADEVFDDLVENCLFSVSINKYKAKEYYNQLIKSINWICEIRGLSKEENKQILKNLTKRFESSLKSKDSDYAKNPIPQKTDCAEFMKLWNLILNDVDSFISSDFTKFTNKFIKEDLSYFENIKNKLSSYKRNYVLDEIYMISTAINSLNLDKDEEIYDFIKQINYDLITFLEQNKKITEEDKVNLIKRRCELFCDKNKKEKNYFKKMIISLNE